jgi:hypothetical protein
MVLDAFVLQALALSFVVPAAALAQRGLIPRTPSGSMPYVRAGVAAAIVGSVLLKLLTMRPRRQGAGRRGTVRRQCAEGSWCTPAHAEAPAGT